MQAKARRVLQPVNSTIPVTAEALKQTKLSKSDTNIGGHPTIFTDQLKNSQEIYHGSNGEQEYHISKKAMTQSNVNRMYKPKNVDSVKKNSVGTKDPHEIYRQVFTHRSVLLATFWSTQQEQICYLLWNQPKTRFDGSLRDLI